MKKISMNNNLKSKEMFSSRFSELMKERFPLKNKHKEEKQDKRTARENFELLQKLDIDIANNCKNSNDRNKATAKIRKWRNPLNKEMPTLQTAIKLCKILECDIEYIFGISDIKNKNIFQASSYLGLNQKTIEEVRNYSDIIKELIDIMVCEDSDILKYILFNILQYVRYFNVPRMTIQTISDDKPRELSYDEKQNYIKSVTIDEFSSVLHEINTRYESIRESDFEREKKFLELEIKVEQLKIAKLKE